MLRIEMRNLNKFSAQLQLLKQKFPEELEQFLLDIAKSLERATVRRTPVLTGDLKKGWRISSIKRQGDKLYIEVYNDATTTYEGRTVPLAPFVEFGHAIVNQKGETVGKADGFYMLTTSIKTVNRQIPRRLKKVLDRVLGE